MSEGILNDTGIDKALRLGAQGGTRLEYTEKPTLKDKKDARDLYKRASKILDAVIALEEEDIYETGPKPDVIPLPGVPLNFDGPAMPPPMPKPEPVREPVGALGYTDVEVVDTVEFDQAAAPQGWDQKDPGEQAALFGDLLDTFERDCHTAGASLKDLKPQRAAWLELFCSDRRRAWILLYALYYGGPTGTSMEIPSEDQLPELLAAAQEGEDA